VDRTRSGGFRDQAYMSLFVLLLGPFGLLAPMVPVLGYHGQPLYFHVLSLILGFAFPLNLGSVLAHSRYEEGSAGGSCLFLSMVVC
jgi:hypothetical protein